jgi:thiol-disulfide isomerase/thioredoxin
MKIKILNLKFGIILLLFISTIIVYSCKSEDKLPAPEVKSGCAKLSGRLIYDFPVYSKDKEIMLTIYHPVSASKKKFVVKTMENGFFHFDNITLETNYAIAFLNAGIRKNIIIGLKDGEETKLEIICDSLGLNHINASQPISFTSSDMINSPAVMDIMLRGNHPAERAPLERLYEKDIDYYVRFFLKQIDRGEEIADDDDRLSGIAKQILKNEFKMNFSNTRFFDYKNMLYIDYFNTTEGKGEDSFDSLNISEPDRSYYSFLKALKLNDPLLLYSSEYSNCLQAILQNDTLAIPPIGDAPIKEWLKNVKGNISELVGFDRGLFYDMLAANAYVKQFNDKALPLSETQKQNIKNYFSNRSFVEILLKKNEEIEKVAGITAHLQINETPTLPDGKPIETYSKENKNLPDGKLMDSIVSKYRGKVVVIDFWATWCGPCVAAMSESRELKAEMINKGVVFVYIQFARTEHGKHRPDPSRRDFPRKSNAGHQSLSAGRHV